MAFEVTRVYREHFPALRFIGLRYTNADRFEGGFGKQWGEWEQQDRFGALKKAIAASPYDETGIGLMIFGGAEEFTYWIGLFFPAGTQAPDGFDYYDFPESDIGIGWVYGNEENGEIYGGPPHEAVCARLGESGMGSFRNDLAGVDGGDVYCFFERYNCPRFTHKDAAGNVTLDYGAYIFS